ncbi:winged helix-turn-helix domain-containing protein [Tessaracoccus antarcticus]|nr:crosslink repair DNA glycosylase YcaQ family protein [Tessaracoccus antarcticus]
MGTLQIDSVNVLARSQFLPLFSRLGPYDQTLLARAAHTAPRRITEYWAHQAAFIPVALHPLFRWRMQAYAEEAWGSIRRAETQHAGLVHEVLAAIGDLGPITPSRLTVELGHDPASLRAHWGWNWNVVKTVCEFLFFTGQIATAARTSQFERVFDLPERVLPADVLGAPTPSVEEAHRRLVEIAARAHGIGTVKCLADYWRLKAAPTRRAVDELVEEGALVPVSVDGTPAYLHVEAAVPRRVRARALLSPFDPLVWERDRALWLFGFHYRIGIYTPAEQRVHGYYVLPFLLDGDLVGRVDLKADRASGRLLVQSAWQEPGAPMGTAEELAQELFSMADWLHLDDVVVASKGDLARELAACCVPGIHKGEVTDW